LGLYFATVLIGLGIHGFIVLPIIFSIFTRQLPFRCQFHQRFTRKFFVQISPQSQNVTREKLPKQCLYEKFVRKMLMKLTAGNCWAKIRSLCNTQSLIEIQWKTIFFWDLKDGHKSTLAVPGKILIIYVSSYLFWTYLTLPNLTKPNTPFPCLFGKTMGTVSILQQALDIIFKSDFGEIFPNHQSWLLSKGKQLCLLIYRNYRY